MENHLKIIIFDGSFKTTSFINRLIIGLALKHEIYVLGFNEEMSQKIKNVHYVALGSNQNKLRFVGTSLYWAIRSGSSKIIFSSLKNLLQGNRHLLQAQNLYQAINSINPDLIHLQWPSTISWFEQVLQEQKIPVVLSQRGFHNNVKPFIEPENFTYLQKYYPLIAGFHSVSKAISLNGDKIWKNPKKVDKVVYTGLDLQHVPFIKDYQVSNPLQIISFGRSHWIKGYSYALRACKLLKDKGVSFHYTIIGAAGDEELQFLIADLELENHVILELRISQSEVLEKMRNADLMLVPSLEEGIPNVAVEAMAVGLPVLSTNCGGVPELIDDGIEGWLVETRSPEAIAGGVERFLNLSLPEIQKVRLAAREKVEMQHNLGKMVLEMEELYYEVLSKQIV